MSSVWIIPLLGLVLYQQVVADVHSYGFQSSNQQNLMTKELYRSSSPIPKNYTIVLRQIIPYPGPSMSYAEIRVENSTSSGNLEYDEEKHTINATITIPNAVNIVVTFKMNGFGSNISLNLNDWTNSMIYGNRRKVPQSFTIVNVQSAAIRPANRTFWHNSIGRRQPTDRLIHFSSQNVTKRSNFASDLFEFAGGEGQAITYVQFTFDSPTAVAFLNSTFIEKHEFAAIVYDLSALNFVANVSIFGYEDDFMPESYQSILGYDKIIKK